MSAGSGVVSVRFDVTGNEQLIAALKTIATSSKGLTTEFTAMQGKLAAPMGGLGPLQGLAAGVGAAETKVTSFRGSLASIGTQLGQNATSFGVATASIWGVYNAYDSLTKVEIRAHSAAVRVSTLETTLASLTERRRIAVEKGNLTGEQLAVLNERIADTQEKLSVAQERSADVAQDVQEAWVGFASQVGPQIVAAGGSIAQLFTTLTSKAPGGISAITKMKESFVSLFSSLGGAGGGAIAGLSSVFTKIKTGITGTTASIGPLDNAMRGAGGSTGFLSSSMGVFAISAGIAAVAAVAIAAGVMEMQKNMEAAGLKMATMRFGLLDTKQAQLSFDQMDAILQKFAEHGQTVSIAWISMFPTEALAKFKEFGGQINETTGQIIPLATAVSELGAGFTSTREEFTTWAADLLKGGKDASQVYMWLINSQIKDSDALQILTGAQAKNKASTDALGITTERYNAIGVKAKDIIGLYINRVKTGQVPLEALTGSIHGQVQAWQESTGASEEEGKVLEDLIIKQLKTANSGKALATVIDKTTGSWFKASDAVKASAVAYLGLDAVQGKSIGQLQNFNETVGKTVDSFVEQGLAMRKTAEAEELVNQTTIDTIDTWADYIEKMINVNSINDESATSYGKIRQAQIDGKKAAEAFVTQSVLGKEATDAESNALLKEVQKFTDATYAMHLTTDQLHKIYDAEVQTKTGTLELEKVLASKLIPAFEHFKGLFDATTMKEFGKTWKELGKSGAFQGVPKDLKSSLKDIGKDLVDINKHGQEASNVIDALLVNVYSGRNKGNESGIKAILKDLEHLPGADKIKPVTDELARIMDLPKAERTRALKDYTDTLLALEDAMKPDSPGGRAITSGEATGILNINSAAKEGKSPVDTYAGSIDTLTDSIGAFNTQVGQMQGLDKHTTDVLNQGLNAWMGGGDKQKEPTTPTSIPPPKPVVFPPPDLSNILTGVSKAEIMMSEMVKYAAGLTIAFPEPKTNAIITGVSKAQIVSGDLVTYVAGLPLAFPGINIVGIANSTSSASKAAATLVPDIAGLKPMFPGVNIVGVVNSTSSAKKAAATLVPDIKALKPAFPGVNIIGVVNSTTNAKNAASKLEGHVAGLDLKFPGIDISNISSSVNSAQNKIDSLHGKNIVNHVSTVFDNAGGNILNDAMITSAANGKLFTTNGEQLFRVGDNPGGRETIAIIPHDKPHEIMERLSKMFPPINSLLHERARKPSMQTISGHSMGGRTSAGSTMVNVTTQVYLFPGSEMFKKYVRQIMVEDLGRQMTA